MNRRCRSCLSALANNVVGQMMNDPPLSMLITAESGLADEHLTALANYKAAHHNLF